MKQKPYWIKQRYNPQLGTYYIACGKLSKTMAMAFEKSLYGENTMHQFDTETEYPARLAELRASGETVH